jgi:hypothetical protein
MPQIRVTEWQQDVKIGKGTFNVIKGVNLKDGKDWEKKYFAADAGINGVMEIVEPGDVIDCLSVKQGKFWNLESVELVSKASEFPSESPQESPQTSSNLPTEKLKPTFLEGGDSLRQESLRLSVALVSGQAASVSSTDGVLTFGDLCKAALGIAGLFYDYMCGKKVSFKSSDDGDGTDEDIPF